MSVGGISSASGMDYAQMAQKFFKKADANGDGSIDKSELKTMLSKGPGGAKSDQEIDKIFAKMDTDGDGKISESENENQMKKMAANGGPVEHGGTKGAPPKGGAAGSSSDSGKVYDPKDKNKDGVVSAQEEIEYDILHPETSGEKTSGYDQNGNLSSGSDSFSNSINLSA
jgi:hypothetical protein